MNISDLKARVAMADYAIDANAVAEAFIARMQAMRAARLRADVRELLGRDALDEIRQPA